jgi:DNA-binding NarL/FixJ family response regulator
MRVAVFSPDPLASECLGCLLKFSGGIDVVACGTRLDAAETVVRRQGVNTILVTDDLLDDVGLSMLGRLKESLGPKLLVLWSGAEPTGPPSLFDGTISRLTGSSGLLAALRRLQPNGQPAPGTTGLGGDLVESHLRLTGGRLSPRERRAGELVGKGMSNRSIARIMTVSEQSVKNYVHSLMRKLGCESRLQLGLLFAGVEPDVQIESREPLDLVETRD